MEENIKAWNTIKTWNTRACKELRWIPVEEALPEAYEEAKQKDVSE